VTPPSVRIVLTLEAAPRVVVDFLCDDEEVRMIDWFDAHPGYQALLADALALEREGPA
jgi:hypothetical protein